ncbi:helix-turn-helix domain-containing protein [Labrys neptuniae]
MKRGPPTKHPGFSSQPNATFEYVLTGNEETFLWRRDNYPWERNVWNFHPEVEIHLITNASGFLLVGDHIGKFHPGELTVVGSNLPHDWVTPLETGDSIPGRDIVIQFHPDKLQSAAVSLPEIASCSEFLKRAERGLSFHSATRLLATEIILKMENLRGLARLTAFLELLNLLASSNDYLVLSSQAYSPDLEHGSLATLQGAFSYIFANLSRDIHLPEVAAIAGMSDTAFSRFFKKNTGHSFTDHITKLRLWRASQLLAETRMPITEICFEVGYTNISNFNRMFLRHHRLTPSGYRRLAAHRHLINEANRPVGG